MALLSFGMSVWAYTPFLDPLPVAPYWLWMLLPLVVIVAVVYKTIKIQHLPDLPASVLKLSTQIVVFMVLAAAALWLVTYLV